MMMMMFITILLSLFVLASARDFAPIVHFREIGVDYVTLEVSGSNVVDDLPVKTINVNYSIETNQMVDKLILPHIHQNLSLGFNRMINITNLNPGSNYRFQIYLSNERNQQGPSTSMNLLLRPQTPDFSINHQKSGSIRLFWGYPNEKQIDYFVLTVEKLSAPGCGFAMNFTRCYGNQYDLANFEHGETYIFEFVSHNQSGDSDVVQVIFPYD